MERVCVNEEPVEDERGQSVISEHVNAASPSPLLRVIRHSLLVHFLLHLRISFFLLSHLRLVLVPLAECSLLHKIVLGSIAEAIVAAADLLGYDVRVKLFAATFGFRGLVNVEQLMMLRPRLAHPSWFSSQWSSFVEVKG